MAMCIVVPIILTIDTFSTDNGDAEMVSVPVTSMVSSPESTQRVSEGNPRYRFVRQIHTEIQTIQTRLHVFHGVYRLGGLKFTPHQDCLLCLMTFSQQDMAGRNTTVITAFPQPSRRSRESHPFQIGNIINIKSLPLPRQMKRPNGREDDQEEQPEEQPRR